MTLRRRVDSTEPRTDCEPLVIWAHDRGGWWCPNAMGYTPNLVEAGVFTSTDGLNLTKADEVRKLSEYSFSKGSVGEILASGILKGASS